MKTPSSLFLFLSIIVFLVSVCACSHVPEQKQKSEATQKIHIPIENFDSFIEQWNSCYNQWNKTIKTYNISVCNIPSFELSRDKIRDTTTLFQTLEQWTSAFSSKPEQRYFNALAKVRQKQPSTFEFYEEFRTKHFRDHPLSLKDLTNSIELAMRINEYVGVFREGEPADTVEVITLENIISMNDVWAYYITNEDFIKDQEVDIDIRTCKDLEHDYPELYKLCRKD